MCTDIGQNARLEAGKVESEAEDILGLIFCLFAFEHVAQMDSTHSSGWRVSAQGHWSNEDASVWS